MTLATERICRTVDGRYVRESDPTAAFLACAVGQELPDDFTGFEAEKVEPNVEAEKVEGAPTPKKKRA